MRDLETEPQISRSNGEVIPTHNHSEDKFKCDFCNSILEESEMHECDHINGITRIGEFGTITAGDGTGDHICKYCGARFLIKSRLNKHKKHHIRPYKCNFCPLGFPEVKELTRHLNTHSTNQTNTFLCDECDQKFTRKDNLTKHRKKYHP